MAAKKKTKIKMINPNACNNHLIPYTQRTSLYYYITILLYYYTTVLYYDTDWVWHWLGITLLRYDTVGVWHWLGMTQTGYDTVGYDTDWVWHYLIWHYWVWHSWDMTHYCIITLPHLLHSYQNIVAITNVTLIANYKIFTTIGYNV